MKEVIPFSNVPTDELLIAIEEAQHDLAQASETPQLRKDPLRIVLSGISATLGVLGRSTKRWEKATSDVIASRSPLSNDVKAEIIDAVKDGAFRGMRNEANRMIRTLDRRLSIQIGLCVGVAFVIGSLLGFGSGWYVHSPVSELACADQVNGSRACWMYTRLPTKVSNR